MTVCQVLHPVPERQRRLTDEHLEPADVARTNHELNSASGIESDTIEQDIGIDERHCDRPRFNPRRASAAVAPRPAE